MPSLPLLCEDGPLLAVNKPSGLPTQAPSSVDSMENRVKEFLKQKYAKPGNVYLGVPHRLDRPVSGVVVFARNSKAAARLAEQFRLRQVRKFYLALIEGQLDPPAGTLAHWLLKVPGLAHMNVVPEGTSGAKLATLKYRVLPTPKPLRDKTSLVLVEPQTGRMHQIRVQLAQRNCPIVGDRRYGARLTFGDPLEFSSEPSAIALHAARLDLHHPIRYDPLSLIAPLPDAWASFGILDPRDLLSAET